VSTIVVNRAESGTTVVEIRRKAYIRLMFQAARDGDMERLAYLLATDEGNLLYDRARIKRRLLRILQRHCLIDIANEALRRQISKEYVTVTQFGRIYDMCHTFLVDAPDPKWFMRAIPAT
jgi:hypothetical protein